MSKPEDISEDVWKAAGEFWAAAGSEREAVARAIIAAEKRGEERERDRCAGKCDEAATQWNDSGNMWLKPAALAASDLAAAIRRGTP